MASSESLGVVSLQDAPVEATASQELPVFFQTREGSLLGFLTRPSGEPLGAAAIALAGGARQTSMGRNRLLVRLCRRIAGGRVHAFRFDYHGVGESTGLVDGFSLEAPFVHDFDAATACVENQGLEPRFYVGVCFGARTVLAGVSTRPGVVGVALVEPPVRDLSRRGRKRYSTGDLIRLGLRPWVLAGLLHREQRAYYAKFVRSKLRAWRTKDQDAKERDDLSWVGSGFVDALEGLVDRGVRVLLIYGSGGVNHLDFRAASAGRLGSVLDRAGSLIEVVAFPGELHGFSDLASQERVIDEVGRWSQRVAELLATPFGEGGDRDA